MGYLLCPLCCGRSFSNRKSLQYHLLASESNISCPECNERFETIVDLVHHLELENCNQKAVFISVKDEIEIEDDKASKDYVLSEEVVTSVISQEIGTRPSSSDQEVCHNVQITEESTDWVAGTDEVVTEELENDEMTTILTHDDVDVIREWEQDLSDEGTEHYCNSCNCQIQGVLEHINEFHPSEMVILQNAEVIDTEEVSTQEDIEYEEESTSFLPDNISPPKHTKDKHKTNYKQGKKKGKFDNKVAHSATAAATNAVVVQNSSPEGNHAGTDIPKEVKGKVRQPKMYDTVDEANMVDPKTGIPYIRRIVHIEKFWEDESFKLSLKSENIEDSKSKSDDENVLDEKIPKSKLLGVKVLRERRKKLLGRKNGDEPIETAKPILKTVTRKNGSPKAASPVKAVPPKLKKNTLIQAHINQILRSGAIDQLKETWVDGDPNVPSNDDILQKILSAANDCEENTELNEQNGESGPEITLKSEIKEEDRTTTIKFVSDTGDTLVENTIPIFLCNACGAEFTNPHHFASHKCKVSKSDRMTLCEICGIKCRSSRNLRLHMENHNPKTKAKKLFEKQVKKLLSTPAMCDVCHTEFTTVGGLKVHQRMHRPDNIRKVAEMNNKVEYRCDLCKMVCFSERTFRIHYKVHLNCQQGEIIDADPLQITDITCDLDRLSCKLCGETFSSNENLKSHWQAHYPDEFKSMATLAEEVIISDQVEIELEEDGEYFNCHLCGKRLLDSLRDIHMKMHRGEIKFGCSVCNKHFNTETDLEFHMTTHRTEMELECLTCKTKFTDPNLLKLHRKTHAGSDRPYPCGFCGRRFSRPHEKVKHERIHTGEKPYACAVCGMRFRVGYCLKMHERIHTGVRPYSCEQCGKTFRARSGYKQHIRLHSEVRAFVCPFCPKTFKTVVQLAGHKKSHTKPYACPDCGRRFATMYMMRAHIKTHSTSSLKHACHICGASYGRDYALKDHLKLHGKNVPPMPENENEDEPSMEITSDLSTDTNRS